MDLIWSKVLQVYVGCPKGKPGSNLVTWHWQVPQVIRSPGPSY